MNNEEFIEQAKTDSATTALLTEIADEVRGVPAPKTYLEVGIVDILWGAAGYAVWSLVKIGVDHLRGMSVLNQAKEKAKIAESIGKETGLDSEKANAIVDASLAEIAKRNADDPLLQKMQSLIASKEGTTD